MKHFLATVGFALMLSGQAHAGDAVMAEAGNIMIHDGWARASLGSAPNSAAYMTLMINSGEADKLVAVATPLADSAELHTHMMDDGIARMRPVEAIEIAPGEPTILQPGGLHVMLMGLRGKLDEGSTLPMTLTFENAGDVTLDVPILSVKAGMQHGKAHKHGS